MTTIIGISGSLKRSSYNAGLLRAAAEAAPEGCEINIVPIHDIPLYNGDVEENEGIPQSVSDLKERIVAADGLLMVTPEYNNSISGVFKNTIDWLSRPPEDRFRVFEKSACRTDRGDTGHLRHGIFPICLATDPPGSGYPGLGRKVDVDQRCHG